MIVLLRRLARGGTLLLAAGMNTALATPVSLPAPAYWIDAGPDWRDPGDSLLAERRPSSNGTDAPPGLIPDAVLHLDPSIEGVLVADLERRRLYLLAHDGQLRVLRQMYASIGKNGIGKQLRGDERTPVGIYQIERYLEDAALPELYGSGAYPVNYPNSWDRRLGRGGDGIWIHGVPRDQFSRPPQSSEGCVAIGNADLDSLRAFVTPGQVPVIFTDQLRWVSPAAQAQAADAFLPTLEAWRAAWSRRDTAAYLSFYAEDFRSGGMDRAAFAAHKHQVNTAKKFIDVQISQINLFRYPADVPLLLAEFVQEYRSDNYQETERKQQFWQQQADGQWLIVQESKRLP